MGNKVCCTSGGGSMKEGDTKYDSKNKKIKKYSQKKLTPLSERDR